MLTKQEDVWVCSFLTSHSHPQVLLIPHPHMTRAWHLLCRPAWLKICFSTSFCACQYCDDKCASRTTFHTLYVHFSMTFALYNFSVLNGIFPPSSLPFLHNSISSETSEGSKIKILYYQSLKNVLRQ